MNKKNKTFKNETKQSVCLIGIEGNISTGKSTFCSKITGNYVDKKLVHCQYETINQTLLKLFYDDQKRYAFPLQLSTMTRRMQDLKNLILMYSYKKDICTLDRTMFGDFIFAIKHILSNNLTKEEAKVYFEETILNKLSEMLKKSLLNSIIYLHSTPHSCRKNVAGRGAVDQDVKEDYLNEVDDLYFYGILNLLITGLVPVYVVDWRNFGDALQTFTNIYNKIKNNNTESSKLTMLPVGNLYCTNSVYPINIAHIINNYSGVIEIPFDDLTENIPSESLPCLQKKWRVRHTQEWKNKIAKALSSGLHVFLTRKKEISTLLDMFSNLELFIQ